MLEPVDLNQTDHLILDELEDGRLSPIIAKKRIEDDKDVAREYVQQRMKRMEENGHLHNILSAGVYELIDDPRGDCNE